MTGGASELLGDGKAGYTCRAGDPVDCARALMEIIDGDCDIEVPKEHGLKRVQEEFSLSATVTKIEKFFEDVIEHH